MVVLCAPLPRGQSTFSHDHPPSSTPSGAKASPPATGVRALERGPARLLCLVAMVALPGRLARCGAAVIGRRAPQRHGARAAPHPLGRLPGRAARDRSGRHLALTTLDLVPEGRPRRAARVFTGGSRRRRARCSPTRRRASSTWSGRPGWWRSASASRGAARHAGGFAVMSVLFAWRAGDGGARWPLRAAALAHRRRPRSALGVVAPGPALATAPASLVVLAAFLLGAPVFVGMAGVAMVLFFVTADPSRSRRCPTETFTLVSSPTLAAIPLLTVAGYVLAEGGAAQRLVRAYRGLFGWMPGGLAVMARWWRALHHLHRRLRRHHPGARRPAPARARSRTATRRASRSASSPRPARSASSSRRRCR